MPKTDSSKSNKTKKNSKGTKRRHSAYMIFSSEKRNQIKSENPGLSPKEIMKELGAQWSSSDPQTKQYYQKLADNKKGDNTQKSNNNNNKENTKKDQPNQSMEVNSSQ